MSGAEWEEEGAIEMVVRAPDSRVRSVLGGIAVAVVAALLWMLSGPLGLLGGGLLLLAWAVLPATYAFAVGQVVFIVVTRPDGFLEMGLIPIVLVELGLGGVLVGPMLQSTGCRRSAIWTLLGGGVLAVLALASFVLWGRLWVTATILLGISALVAYGFHRYELVVLGKVSAPDNESIETIETDDEEFDAGETGGDENGTRSQGDSEYDLGGDSNVDEKALFGDQYNNQQYATGDSNADEGGFDSTNGGAESDKEDEGDRMP